MTTTGIVSPEPASSLSLLSAGSPFPAAVVPLFGVPALGCDGLGGDKSGCCCCGDDAEGWCCCGWTGAPSVGARSGELVEGGAVGVVGADVGPAVGTVWHRHWASTEQEAWPATVKRPQPTNLHLLNESRPGLPWRPVKAGPGRGAAAQYAGGIPLPYLSTDVAVVSCNPRAAAAAEHAAADVIGLVVGSSSHLPEVLIV